MSKTAAKTLDEFDYDGPSMKSEVPGPRSKVSGVQAPVNGHVPHLLPEYFPDFQVPLVL